MNVWVLFYKPGHEQKALAWFPRHNAARAIKGIYVSLEVALAHREDDAYDIEEFQVRDEL